LQGLLLISKILPSVWQKMVAKKDKISMPAAPASEGKKQ
jgi:hypothetical protein